MNQKNAQIDEAVEFLKLLANPNRLAVLCALCEQNHNVTELMEMVGMPQAAMSNQLGKLREAGLIDCHIHHREREYYLSDPKVIKLIGTLHEIFCQTDE